MKTITSYKELLESFLKQIKESEVTDERAIDLSEHIEGEIYSLNYDEEWLHQFNTKTIMEQLAIFAGDDYDKLITALLVTLDHSPCTHERMQGLKEFLENEWSEVNTTK